MRISVKERIYDYETNEEMQTHVAVMKERGWTVISTNDMEGDKWKFTATFRTGILWNGVNGR